MSVSRVCGILSRQYLSNISGPRLVASTHSSALTSSFGLYQPQRNYGHFTKSILKNCSCASCRQMTGSPIGIHTKVDKDLATFLKSEVEAERQLSKVPAHGPGIPGFDLKTEGANVTLTKKVGSETITVKFNVNGVLDVDDPEPAEEGQEQQNTPPTDMRARPDFVVEVAKPNGRILAFTCRLYPDEPQGSEEENDKFEIETFTILNAEEIDEFGEWDDNIYVADGSIVDGQMYDLLLNFLESRGINAEFANSLMDYATHYEHNNYIGLLEKLRDFVDEK